MAVWDYLRVPGRLCRVARVTAIFTAAASYSRQASSINDRGMMLSDFRQITIRSVYIGSDVYFINHAVNIRWYRFDDTCPKKDTT